MNNDYKRENGRVERMNKFLSDNDIESAWNVFYIDFTHESEKDGITFTSTLDHIFWNTDLRKAVLDSGVVHLIDNTSDHHPILYIVT